MKSKYQLGAYYTEKIITIFFFAVICYRAIHSFMYPSDYLGYEVSDWLINYQGGFVRRGLIGELLLQLEQVKTYNVRHAILGIEIVFYILFFSITFRIFIKYKWSFLTAMFSIVYCFIPMSFYRRDFMMLCLCALTYYLFFKYLKEKRKRLFVLSIILMSLSIIIYEPVFFVLVPILALQYWYACDKRKWLKTALVFIFPTTCMLLSCVYNGNETQADAIWQSWMPYMTADGYNPADGMGKAVNFLKFTNDYVFKIHFENNFGNNLPLSIITLIIVLSLAFFMCTNIPQINNKQKKIILNGCNNELGHILTFQILTQLPLFTVLSIDYGRTIPMSLYTSFFLFHYAKVNGVTINITLPLEKTADKIT